MGGCWLHDTQQGTFRIEQGQLLRQACFIVLYEDEPLGCFASAQLALERLVSGQVHPPSCGLCVPRLPLPRSLDQWIFAPQPGAPSPHA